MNVQHFSTTLQSIKIAFLFSFFFHFGTSNVVLPSKLTPFGESNALAELQKHRKMAAKIFRPISIEEGTNGSF